jgi:hypothetical protein
MKFILIYITIGILLNLKGPLANHLRIEDNFALKDNENKSWFFKYSLIFLFRIVATVIYPIFYFNLYVRKVKPIVPVSFVDTLNASVVKRFRSIGELNNAAPTDKMTDDKIIEIYTLICTKFRKASVEREERILADNLNIIALKFFNVYENFGDVYMKEHLEYEVNKYKKEGLRPEYKREIALF